MRGFPAAATPRRRAWPLVSRLGHISGHFGREPGRLSQVSGEPSCAFALLSDPAGADRPAMADGPCRSPSIDRESHPAAGIFRGSITRLRHPPPTLPASIALHGQGWLPAAWLAVPGGVRLHGLHPLGSSREFQWQFPCLSPPFAPAFAWRDDSDPDPEEPKCQVGDHPLLLRTDRNVMHPRGGPGLSGSPVLAPLQRPPGACRPRSCHHGNRGRFPQEGARFVGARFRGSCSRATPGYDLAPLQGDQAAADAILDQP